MNGLRKHFTMGLVLVMCTLTGHCGRSAPSVAAESAAADGGQAHLDLRRMVEIMKHVEENRRRPSAKTQSRLTPRVHTSPVEPKDLRTLKRDRGVQAAVVFPQDLRKKEKFLEHITGPLYFSRKCRKQVYRVYHTRDCTTPAC